MRPASARSTPLLLILALASVVPLLAGGAPNTVPLASRQTTPAPIAAAPAPPRTADESHLVGDLADAKRAGDMTAARALEDRLADLRGKPRPAPAPAQPTPPGFRAVHLPAGAPAGLPRWQGNDVLVAGGDREQVASALASRLDGTLFAAVEHADDSDAYALIYRSTDGGESWDVFFSLQTGAPVSQVSLAVGEGTENWLLAAMRSGEDDIVVFRVNLDDPGTYDWSSIDTLAGTAAMPTIVTDSREYAGWYAYVVFNKVWIEGWSYWQSRSLDFGATWTAPDPEFIGYYCTSTAYADLDPPSLAFGAGRLHLAYSSSSGPCHPEGKEIHVRRSDDFGSSWTASTRLTNNTAPDFAPAVAAVENDDDTPTAVVAFTRLYIGEDTDIQVATTADGGLTWAGPTTVSGLVGQDESHPAAVAGPPDGRIHLAYWHDGDIDHAWAQESDLVFTRRFAINYGGAASPSHPRPAIIRNPTLPADQEAGIIWTDVRASTADVYFDGPATVGVGTVIVDAEPDALAAPWSLVDPDGAFLTGSGDAAFTDVGDGDWTLTWLSAGSDWALPAPVTETRNLVEGGEVVFTGTYRFIPPVLVSIADVGGDQGRNVRLSWERSAYDAPGEPATITGYQVYRRQDEFKAAGDDRLAGWDAVAWVSAHGEATYDLVAPTLCDSTADGGICWSVFMVRATTGDPFTFWDSPPDSGYSVDNLVPNVPANVALVGSALAWDPVDAPDLRYYSVYTSDSADFTAFTLVGRTTATALDVSGAAGDFFAVTASDFAGNESDLSAVVGAVTGVPAEALPRSLALLPAAPNPFNPMTTVRFDLPRAGEVRLAVYRLDGKRVRTLVHERRDGGRHAVVWDGRDGTGREAPSGVYVARLEAAGVVQAQRLTLVR